MALIVRFWFLEIYQTGWRSTDLVICTHETHPCGEHEWMTDNRTKQPADKRLRQVTRL